jgi:hypothetical protein
VSSAEDTDASPTTPAETRRLSRVRGLAGATKALFRVVYRDPQHVSERITLYTVDRLADEAQQWAKSVRAERSDTHLAVITEELRVQTAQIARVDGAIAGTPFMLALIPGYLTYLWQEMRMTSARRRCTTAIRTRCGRPPRCSRCAVCIRPSSGPRRS